MASGVQFYGIDKVMEMFDSRKVDAWSIWHGKEFQFKGHGDGELRTTLEALKNSFNDPIYTLRVYEGLDSADKIKSNTPHDGSFNFKINIPMEVQGMGFIPGNANHALLQRIEKLETEKRELEEEEFGDEPDTIGSVVDTVIIEALRDPEKLRTWKDVIMSIFNPNHQPAARPYQAPAAMIGNSGNPAPITEMTDEGNANRLIIAIDKLEKADPKILEHLEKLADISEKNPPRFNVLLTMLNTFQ